jgi:hypothetical protein
MSGTGHADLFCEVRFARGAGLGTRLFPWARCRVFARLHDCQMLAPAWRQWRVGPLLRGGIDVRSYHRQILLVGQFRDDAYASADVARRARRYARLPEPHEIGERPRDRPPVVVRFEGPGTFFEPLAPHRAWLREALHGDAHPKWVALADRVRAPIGINVRCGHDFRAAQSETDYMTKGAIRTPLMWFIEALRRVRDLAGAAVPAIVVSDGTQSQLQPLLDEPNVRFGRPGSAISDLLTLASSDVLIGSGGSSFSAWASFLSGAPTITHRGQSLEWFRLRSSSAQFVGELAPGASVHPEFARQVAGALGAKTRREQAC